MPHKPSVVSLVLADYASALCFLFPVVLWGMFAAATSGLWSSEPGEREFGAHYFCWFAIAATVVFLPLLCWRIQRIRSLVRDGIVVPARIISVWFASDRGRIDYEYSYAGQTHRGGMALVKSKRTGQLQAGGEIIVLVDPRNPSRSIIRDVFD